jgi:hypothetical protein
VKDSVKREKNESLRRLNEPMAGCHNNVAKLWHEGCGALPHHGAPFFVAYHAHTCMVCVWLAIGAPQQQTKGVTMQDPKHVITVLTGGRNPKVQFATRKGQVVPLASYKRFAFYLDNPGCTVAQYSAWCADPAQRDIADKSIAAKDYVWDMAHGFITIGPAVALPAPQDTIADTVADTVAADTVPAVAPAPALTKAQRKALRKVKAA